MAFDSTRPVVKYHNQRGGILQEEGFAIGKLAHGFNVVDGSTKATPFSIVELEFNDGLPAEEKLTVFSSYDEYNRGSTKLVGIDDFQEGMFSLNWGTRHDDNPDSSLPPALSPFLCEIDKLENYSYYFYSFEQATFELSIQTHTSRILKSKLVKAIEDTQFSPSTKPLFYALIEKYGTHFIHSARYGVKSEMRWTYNGSEQASKHKLKNVPISASTESMPPNVPDNVLEDANDFDASVFSFPASKSREEMSKEVSLVSALIKDHFNQWRQVGFQLTEQFDSPHVHRLEPKPPGKLYQEVCYTKGIRQVLKALHKSQKPWLVQAPLIGFGVTPLSALFTGNLQAQMEMAIKSYISDHRPFSTKDLEDGMVVTIRCMDTGKYCRVNSAGNFLADLEKPSQSSDMQFEIRKREDRIALKSILFNRMLSKATTRPRFRFAHMPISVLGPHETFLYSGHFLLVGTHASTPRYLYIGEPATKEVYGDGGMSRKGRFCFFPVLEETSTVNDTDDLVEQVSTENPKFPEKSPFAAKARRTISNRPPAAAMKGKYPSHLVGREPSVRPHVKFNSTSSIYIRDSINAPDLRILSRCLAIALSYHIEDENEGDEKKQYFELFDEEKHPLFNDCPPSFTKTPPVEEILVFIETIFKAMRLTAECGIMCLAYIERVISATGITLLPRSWRRITLCAMILASKVWEELAVWNVDFLRVFPRLNVSDLNKMEKYFLMYIQYNVSLKASLYTKYFFELRNLANNDFPLKPLKKEGLMELEKRSLKTEGDAKKMQRSRHRTSSLDGTTSMDRTPAILS